MNKLEQFDKVHAEAMEQIQQCLHIPEDSYDYGMVVLAKWMLNTDQNMKAFLGYCKRQAAKYGVRGSRLDAIAQTIKYLKKKQKPFIACLDSDLIVELGLEGLAIKHPEYIKVLNGFDKGGKWIDKKVLQVCESKYDFTCRLGLCD